MRQYRGKVLAALWKDRHVTVKAVLTALALAPLTAWTGHGPPVPAVHSQTRGVTGMIVSAVGGKCLTISPGSPGKTLPAAVLTGGGACPFGSAQLWTLPADNTIRSMGKCLTAGSKANGTGVALATCNGSRGQFWEADGVVQVAGTEVINPWSGKCMTDPNGSTLGLIQVRIYACSRSAAQTWYLPPTGVAASVIPGQAETSLSVAKARRAATAQTPAGFTPTTLQHAYHLKASRGSGRTVAIVDAYDDPNAESDLATYRSTYGLPACTTANGCFRKVGQNGGTSYPAADAGWAAEISLDLDMVSAICPNCHILLAEASSSELSDLGAAVNRAVSLGARFVSNSYGGDESASDIGYDSKFFNHPGVAITVSAGDSGYGVSYPAASRYVTAVGGTSLKPGSNSRGWTETVWGGGSGGGTGSGCSADDAKPTWQKDTGCTRRTIADVAAVADPDTGVAVYDTYQANGWAVYGGTSVASPIIAAVYALAGTPARGSYPASYPYAHASSELNHVTSGSNGSCSPAYLCTAGPGYNGPTGLGTPNGYTAFASP